ncbi:Hypothetical protein MUW33_2781 [Mycobacterium canetti]|uniref:hypothetical protein n=1 Tax=Mycobacterium canetti TaxID=78331 RepID=UPI002D77459B|nr:hypothetical protein [Mycobacterium canetti]WRO42731.1 Hypothetical protein MUW33_2781 [Mycobacterium canetti]
MSSYYVEMTFEMGAQHDRAGFEAHLDDVAEAFTEITDVDGDVGANLATGRVDLCMTLAAADHVEALSKAVTAARTAIHTAGGRTPGWDSLLEKLLDDEAYVMRAAPSDLTTALC